MQDTPKRKPRKSLTLTPPADWVAWHERLDQLEGLTSVCKFARMGLTPCEVRK